MCLRADKAPVHYAIITKVMKDVRFYVVSRGQIVGYNHGMKKELDTLINLRLLSNFFISCLKFYFLTRAFFVARDPSEVLV